MKTSTTHKNFVSVSLALLVAMLLSVAGSAFASTIPVIASGSVSFNGTLQTGTPNVTTSYNSTTGLYQIHLNGICFVRTKYTTLATVSGYNGYPQGALFVNTDDDGDFCKKTGDLVVGLRDFDGVLRQADFQFMVIQNSPTIPVVASGSISFNGTLQTGTPNITTSYNSTTGLYQIHIKGLCFVRTKYTTLATVSGYNGFPQGALFVNTDDDGNFCKTTGDMVVGLRDVDGKLRQADFQFLVIQQ